MVPDRATHIRSINQRLVGCTVVRLESSGEKNPAMSVSQYGGPVAVGFNAKSESSA